MCDKRAVDPVILPKNDRKKENRIIRKTIKGREL